MSGNMKKNMVSFLLFFVMVGGVIGFKTIEASTEQDEIVTMVNILEQNDIEIEEWSIYTKERVNSVIDLASFDEKVNELQSLTKDFQWEFNKKRNVYKAIAVKTNNNKITEKITLASTHKNNKTFTYLIYEAKGVNWNSQNYQDFLPVYEDTKNYIFHGKPTNFSCVKGNFNDTIEEVLYDQARGLLNEFDAEIVELVNEEAFVSVTAYTEKWEQYLPANNGKMNVQLALRKLGLGGKTTVVVGTPIITSEY